MLTTRAAASSAAAKDVVVINFLRSPDHSAMHAVAQGLYTQLAEMWQSGELVDTCVHSSDGVKFTAHKVVLAAHSEFFRALFRSEQSWTESRDGCTLSASASVVQDVLTYMYYGPSAIEVNVSNAQELFMLASMLSMKPLVEQCVEFICEHVEPANALGVRDLADLYGRRRLRHLANLVVNSQFAAVSQEHEFVTLSCDTAVSLLQDDALVVSSEADVLFAALRWLISNISHLDEFQISAVWNTVRLGLVPLENLQQAREMVAHTPQLEASEIPSQLEAIMSQMQCSKTRLQLLRCSHPRNGDINNTIMIMGGYSHDRGRMALAEAYDFAANRWVPARSMRCPRTYFGGTTTSQGILAVGGYVGGTVESADLTLRTCEIFSPATRGWSDVAPLPEPRARCVALSNEAHAFVIGGLDGHEEGLADVLKRPVSTLLSSAGNWERIPMPRPRNMHGAALLENWLYVCGGSSTASSTSSVVDTFERMNIESNSWETLAPMPVPRSGLGFAVLNGCLYAAGGSTSDGMVVKQLDMYNPATNTWASCAPMHYRRKQFALVPHLGSIYALGGTNGSDVLSACERYDPDTNTWTPIASLSFARRGLSANL